MHNAGVIPVIWSVLLHMRSEHLLLPFQTIVMSRDQSENMAAVKKLVVCGGNGFLGSRICKSAVARGWDVTSIRYDHMKLS
jgi:hypothetical protein